MNDHIELSDAGPIEGTFTLDLSSGPGAYEFRGARGTGKTTLISSIDWLAGHKVDVTLHDGAVSGKVEGFGVVAPIGGRKRRKGSLDLDTIDAEKFSLSDLVDPPGKTAEVRDAQAIKALAVLSEAKADPSLYYDLAGGKQSFDALGISDTNDPVLLATRVKQAYDSAAKRHENTATAEAAHAAPLESLPEGLNLNQSSDLSALSNARDIARDNLQKINADREQALSEEMKSKEAKAQLERAIDEYDGPTVEEATQDKIAAQKALHDSEEEVERLEQLLAQAKQQAREREHAYESATLRCNTAEQHEQLVETLRATSSRIITHPSEEDIAEARAAVEAATEAYNQGLRIRDVKANQEKAKAHRTSEEEAAKKAAAERNKASEVFAMLAKSLHTTHLEIRSVDGAPRLFVEHPKRGRTAFDRVNGLSDGERVDFALRELLPHIQTPGLLPIPQRVWQDLQPSDRQKLHELAVERGLYLFGAQVDEGELRVVYLGETGDK